MEPFILYQRACEQVIHKNVRFPTSPELTKLATISGLYDVPMICVSSKMLPRDYEDPRHAAAESFYHDVRVLCWDNEFRFSSTRPFSS